MRNPCKESATKWRTQHRQDHIASTHSSGTGNSVACSFSHVFAISSSSALPLPTVGTSDIFLLLCRDLHSTLIVRVTSDAWLLSLCFFITPKEHEYQSIVDAAFPQSPSEHQGLAGGSESWKAFVFSLLGRFVHLRAIVFVFLRALTDRKLMMPLLRNICFDNDFARQMCSSLFVGHLQKCGM